MTDFDAIAQGMTQAVPFAGYLGLEITSVGEGEATVRLPDRDELTNHVGSQHAGGLFTIAAHARQGCERPSETASAAGRGREARPARPSAAFPLR